MAHHCDDKKYMIFFFFIYKKSGVQKNIVLMIKDFVEPPFVTMTATNLL